MIPTARRFTALLMPVLLVMAVGSSAQPPPPLPGKKSPPAPGRLHVPSPDWRDQIIYFVLTDRFADGDPGNNDQGAGEFAAGQASRYNGGDLRGLLQRLDYVQGLGATALWITPPVANQWLDPSGGYAGYHGYWAEHFMQVDRHLGTLDDYRALSRALHGRGMYLVQDIVLNHTGNYFSYRDRWRAGDPAHGWEAHDRTPPQARPSQAPFDRNDPRDPAQRAAAIYHWTPDVADYTDPQQESNFQMSGLDDLNTENPVVLRALRRSYAHWIREVGVDAFRVDTAFYVPQQAFADFLHARDARAPGVLRVARTTGRRQFHVFGEGFGIDKPLQDQAARKIEGYMTGADGRALLPGMLNFPLYGALGDVFARGRPTADLGHRIHAGQRLHARPHLMPSFVDNHDVDRFLAGGSTAALRQALLALMTLPGIPVIYYGTEQGFTQSRAAMFAAGWASGERDRFDTAAPLYRDIAAMSALRKANRVLSRGVPTVLHASAAGPGALAWRMLADRQQVLVVFNTAEHEVLLDNLATGLAPGTVLQGLYSLDGQPVDQTVGVGGLITLRLPPRSGQVWKPAPRRLPAASLPAAKIQLDPLPARTVAGDFVVTGRAPGVRELKLVVDGDLARAVTVVPDSQGVWQARLDTAAMVDASVAHRVTAWVEGAPAAKAQTFMVARPWQVVADVADPAGDDTGPTGRYTYPTDPSWGDNRQMDLRRVRVATAGGALRLDLGMARLTQSWNPANGFDHVAFTVFIQLPGREDGATVMPLQHAGLPEGMRWHLRLRVHGWSNALFSHEGASAAQEGTPVAPGAGIEVDARTDTVSLVLPASVLGRLPTLAGTRILVSTWDYDAGYRALAPNAASHAMGGGQPDEPRLMDMSPVIVVP
jgi:glycosidase